MAGAVAFVDAAEPEAVDYVVASNLWHFLHSLLTRELGKTGWPFDARTVLKTDPGMSRIPSHLLPWMAS